MFAFLAFIGAAFILWWLAKKLHKIGDTLNAIGTSMAVSSALKDHLGAQKTALKTLKEMKRKTKVISEVITDEEYNEKVREEINYLTNEAHDD